MANISLYVSGQTDHGDVSEFFQKGHMSAGENPIAFFEGVFYESHQERVGNIAFQDYLIYTDKAVYFWARGASKDYLDRFNLGSVSVNSRNKDHDFATLNFKVRRDDKEPVYVIFDMVELREADVITRLHTVIESVIEDHLGLNFRKNLPDEVADLVLDAARGICVPQAISLQLDAPHPSQQESSIGYGQDLLEQYKASIGYNNPDQPRPYSGQTSGAAQGEERHQAGFSPADALKGVEKLLPTDPASLKRIASSIKESIGDTPFKIRDQVMKDLQHVPGMISALTELVTSISDNPQAERFVLNIIKTAVRNDGVLGSVGKLVKLSSSFGGSPKKATQRSSQRADSSLNHDDSGQNGSRERFSDEESGFRKKRVHIKNDDEVASGDDCFGSNGSETLQNPVSAASEKRHPVVDDRADDGAPKRKKISITAAEEETTALVRNMSMTDDVALEAPAPVITEPEEPAAPVARKKVKIVPAEEPRLAEKESDEPLLDEDALAAAVAEFSALQPFTGDDFAHGDDEGAPSPKSKASDSPPADRR